MTPDHPKKLFLLDAFALIYRAYYAFIKNPRINSKGQNTSAAFGFTNALLDVIKKENPTHIAVVFDSPEQTNRVSDFSEYKANREEMPEDIRNMLEPIKAIIEAFDIPILIKPGFEADDIIGTIAKQAEKAGFLTYMMTPDKDFGQLVSENIFMYKPGRGGKPAEVWGVPEIKEKFGVNDPIQVIDILGLWGDAVDNIPGIPGIGEKTSKVLIQKYGSVEGLIAHAHELKGKQKENVINFAEQGLMSKMLATIILDVPVEFDESTLIRTKSDPDKVRDIFTELEFKNMAKRVLGEEIIIPSASAPAGQLDLFGTPQMEMNVSAHETSQGIALTIADTKPNYQLVVSAEKRKQVLDLILQQKTVCFDTETTGLDALNCDIVGLAISYQKGTGFYIAIPKTEAKAILEEFNPFFESETIEKVAHNLKYDLKVIGQYGIEVKGPVFDTMIAHYLFNPEGKHNMDYLSELYLNYKPVSIETLIGKKGKNQLNMGDLEPEKIADYACEDADVTLQLKEIFEKEINKPHLKDLFYEMEMPLVEILKEMETEGINLDVPLLHTFSKQLEKDLDHLETKIKELAGMSDFNIDSPKQLGEVLFDHLKIDAKAKKTKTGQYSTSEDTLQKLAEKHEIIPYILDYRSLKKLKSTYVDAFPALVNPKTGRIHTHYMQTIAATGRLSSTNPNLQNIPIRTERGREMRKTFIPRNKDFLILAADYSQIELRIIAALAEETNMIQAFKDGLDIHAATAAKVFGVADIKEVTAAQRRSAKAVNFGIIYGQSAFGLAQNLGIPRKEAKAIIDSYFEEYPKIKTYMTKEVEFARTHGYVETIMKRRRYLKDIQSNNAIVRGFAERNAVNAPIQGSAADVIKIAMIKLHKAMKKAGLKSKMLLQVHDELVFDVAKDEQEVLAKMVKENMESAVQLSVPLDVAYNIAENWLDAH
ncbi:DNA polymerase I [Putridiphycobacter roseus]|uniref:DNA polymerase I n=1 Tax=Putridiphycobacter roseus TaxID=2219161 RepID=A0A2W1MX78_9FLAO|nr:DNA polymerase I [Putridiphycobacter roseus]PZE16749.1 DNA polymerase I [Putridiphycobacter roseus]